MSSVTLTAVERERERALTWVVLLDIAATFGLLGCGVLAGSLTLIADGLRGIFIVLAEVYAWVTMRRIHRQRFTAYEYGTGKIERLVNVGIALSLVLAAIWIVVSAFRHLGHEPSSSSVFFALAVLISEYNLVVNFWALIRFVRANREEPSIILDSQIQARGVKALSSLVVFAAVLLSGVVPDPTVGSFLDFLGALFVCAMMASTASEMLREAVPDLLDRSLADTTQRAIYHALAETFDDYDDLVNVRSRRSGRQLEIELELGFAGGATVAQVSRLRRRLESSIGAALPDARVTVVPTDLAPPPGGAGEVR